MSTSYLPPAQSLCVRGQRGTGSGSRFLSPFRASAGLSVWASNNASDLINTDWYVRGHSKPFWIWFDVPRYKPASNSLHGRSFPLSAHHLLIADKSRVGRVKRQWCFTEWFTHGVVSVRGIVGRATWSQGSKTGKGGEFTGWQRPRPGLSVTAWSSFSHFLPPIASVRKRDLERLLVQYVRNKSPIFWEWTKRFANLI